MYYKMYSALKAVISQVKEVEDVQWFNAQYEGVAGITPAVFIEFLPLVITRESKLASRMVVDIRLHIVCKTSSEADSDISDNAVNVHEVLAHAVLNSVTGLCLPFEGEQESKPLQLCGWSHLHKQKGYLVSLIDLKTKV